jgi:hypothetical protein
MSEYITITIFFITMMFFLYGLYCNMNMGISKTYYKKYKLKLVISTVCFFIGVIFLIYISVFL